MKLDFFTLIRAGPSKRKKRKEKKERKKNYLD
jgi:hypothetical protein